VPVLVCCGFGRVADLVLWRFEYRLLPNTTWGVQIQQTQAEHNHEIKGTGKLQVASGRWMKKRSRAKQHVVADFAEYFNKEYFSKYTGWYEGIAPGHPSTNNCLEPTNAVIKKECTLRERLPLRELIAPAMEYVRAWSYRLNPENPNVVNLH